VNDPAARFAELEARHAVVSRVHAGAIRHQVRVLAERLGVEPPAWAELRDTRAPKPERAAGYRLRGMSARESRALRLFVRGASLERIARALGASTEETDRWLDDPRPQTFPDAERAAEAAAAE
jgi:DNA-binding NarL/FixJ family response regulator